VNSQDLEKKITLLEESVKPETGNLDSKNKNLEDIERYRKIARAYGYYLENAMIDEFEDLFADNSGCHLEFSRKTDI